jgi:hypothetical protein
MTPATASMTARNSRNASNRKNESNNRSINTECMQAKAGTFATACREATTAGTQCTSGTIIAATSTAAGQLKLSGKSATLEKPATCSRDT